MWRSPDSEPLSLAEQGRVYHIQVRIGAVKRCKDCGQTKPVDQFAAYGRLACWECGMTASERRFRGIVTRPVLHVGARADLLPHLSPVGTGVR